MNRVFNAVEVFEIACQIERNGSRFYMKASEIASAPEAKLFLAKLAEMESEHEKTFSALKDAIASCENKFPDADNLCLSYLRAMFEGEIFNIRDDISNKFTGTETLEQIYLTAIGFEKDSVIFYTSIKDSVPEKLGKNKVDAIIREELCHIAILSRELAAVRSKKGNK